MPKSKYKLMPISNRELEKRHRKFSMQCVNTWKKLEDTEGDMEKWKQLW